MIQETLISKYVHIAVIVSLYWIVSISTVFINKTLLTTIKLDAPLFIIWFQCLTTVFICKNMQILQQYMPNAIKFPEADPFNINVVKKVLPLSILFSSMVATSNLCLKHVSVSFYFIGRSLTTIFNVLFTFLILGEKTSGRSIAFCVTIIFGFVLGIDQENISGSLSVSGTIFGILGSLSLSLYAIYIKRILPVVNNEVWLLAYYNNIYSTFLFIPLMLLNNEYSEVLNYPSLCTYQFWGLMTVGGLCGFFIGICTTLQIKATSPLTHNISGTAKACVQTVLASHWYQESKTFLWWVSNFIVLFGSAGYVRVKQLDMEKRHLLTNKNENI